MAFRIMNLSKYSAITVITGSVKCYTRNGKRIHFSTSKIINHESSSPVKFTQHKAAKIPISEVIELKNSADNNSKLWYENYVLFACFLINFLYFGVLRKENDIDEILKGNSDYNNSQAKLITLKFYLKYCESNKLPTAELKAKIELEEQKLKDKLSLRI